jgi:hypothetical protein
MPMLGASAQFKAGSDPNPRVRAFRGRMGFAVAVMFFCVASVLPAAANGQSFSRTNVTWHTVKASQVSENGSLEDLELEVEPGTSPVHQQTKPKATFPITRSRLGNLAGVFALHPLRSPPEK